MNTKKLCAGVKLCTHKTEQFKTSVVSLNIVSPLDENAGANALLIHLLGRTNKDYPTLIQMNRALAGLYGAMIIPNVQKIGEAQILSLSLVCVDDRFALKGEAIIEKGIELLCDCLLKPDTTPEGFKTENVAREKRLLIEKIESEKDDKRLYALERLTEEMCAGEKYSINKLGSKEAIEAVKENELLERWQSLILSSPIQINVTGNFDEEKTEKIFSDIFCALGRKENSITQIQTEFLPFAASQKTVTEKQSVKQGKLCIGMRTEMKNDFDNYYAMKVMTAIFGSGTFSKLFMNVREKMSLCYYCSARLINSKGIIVIQSGVETENAQKALEAIRSEFEEMKKGSFTDEVIENAKLSLKDSFNSVMDSVMSIDSWLTAQSVSSEFKAPHDLIEGIESVSREQIISAALSVTEDTVFILESEKEEKQ